MLNFTSKYFFVELKALSYLPPFKYGMTIAYHPFIQDGYRHSYTLQLVMIIVKNRHPTQIPHRGYTADGFKIVDEMGWSKNTRRFRAIRVRFASGRPAIGGRLTCAYHPGKKTLDPGTNMRFE